jgi:hypothetical protein
LRNYPQPPPLADFVVIAIRGVRPTRISSSNERAYMLKSSITRKVQREERAAPALRTHFIRQNWGENDEPVQLRIRAKKERDRAPEGDRFVIFRWPTPPWYGQGK